MSAAWKSTYWDDRAPKRRPTRKCLDCPAVFDVNGKKERCSPCSDARVAKRKLERAKERRAEK